MLVSNNWRIEIITDQNLPRRHCKYDYKNSIINITKDLTWQNMSICFSNMQQPYYRSLQKIWCLWIHFICIMYDNCNSILKFDIASMHAYLQSHISRYNNLIIRYRAKMLFFNFTYNEILFVFKILQVWCFT